ncbi:MAG: DsrE family protein [Deltaproteobacteria bacterium]|jgi:intracellular sulfur oxidation DsrE/DsrF family protein
MKFHKSWCAVLLILFCPAMTRAASDWEYPVIKNYGRIMPRPDAAMQPQPSMRVYRVVFDIATSETTDEGVNKGLVQIARYINVMASARAKRMKLAAAIHGEATSITLKDEVHRWLFGIDNPNLSLLTALARAGVKLYVSGQALAEKEYLDDWVASPVEIALSTQVVITDLQVRGWAYVPYK